MVSEIKTNRATHHKWHLASKFVFEGFSEPYYLDRSANGEGLLSFVGKGTSAE